MTDIDINDLLQQPKKKAKLYNHFNIDTPDELHQCDLLFLPEDKGYKYALTLVDCASRYKASRPLKTKLANEILSALYDIYENDMDTPKKLNFDKGSEFDNRSMKTFAKRQGIELVFNEPSNHLAFVENFNKQLAKQLFKYQQQKELDTGVVNREWVDKLQSVVKKMNNTKTRMIDMKPKDAYKLDKVKQPEDKHSEEDTRKHFERGDRVRRLLNKDEIQTIHSSQIKVDKRRATDTYWSMEEYTVVELLRSSPTSLILHKLADDNENIYPHTYNYYQLKLV